MSFLKAEWRKLVILNYEIDPSVLKNDIPFGTELDLWHGKCYLSVVGFMFLNTKILGLKIPFHVNFEEVNLRFYVKRKVDDTWRRGVVFIREIVPKPALTFVANSIYKENYITLPMKHHWIEHKAKLQVQYEWQLNRNWQIISLNAEKKPIEIPQGSKAEFITEHYWGYAKISKDTSNEYEVTHPRWLQYKVIDYTVSINFMESYGERFEFLNSCSPNSVMLAEGSEITVENKITLAKQSI